MRLASRPAWYGPGVNAHDRLFDAILAASVAVEQVGLADGVSFEIELDGSVSLVLGEEGEEQFDDVEDTGMDGAALLGNMSQLSLAPQQVESTPLRSWA